MMGKSDEVLLEYLAELDVSETAVEMFKVYLEEMNKLDLHPNSSEYRARERDALLRIGIQIGRDSPGGDD